MTATGAHCAHPTARAARSRGTCTRLGLPTRAVLVYPGGDWEAHRPSWHGHQVEFAGREGFVRLALAGHVPIVPVVSNGGQDTALFLTRGERVAHALRLDQRFRLKVVPVSLALP
jgi:1-acyl-sn-glycerol-3-phosphate acyltransferase